MATQAALDARFVIYALCAGGAHEYRYVGFTGSKGLRSRLNSHRHQARKGADTPLYDWMRLVGPDNVAGVVLEKASFDSTAAQLGELERKWIALLRAGEYDLLNITPGGLGTSGPMSPERLASHTEAMKRAGSSLTLEQRAAKAERARQQDLSHLISAEALARRAATVTGKARGPYNWTKGGLERKARGGQRGAHLRWHTGREIVKNDCSFCCETGASMNQQDRQ